MLLLSVTNICIFAWVAFWQLCLCMGFETPSHIYKVSEPGEQKYYDIPAVMNPYHVSGFNVSILAGAMGGSVLCNQTAVAHFYPRMMDPMPSFHNLQLFEASTNRFVVELVHETPINYTALEQTQGRLEFWIEPWNKGPSVVKPGRYFLVSTAYDAELVILPTHAYGVSIAFDIPPCEYNRFF